MSNEIEIINKIKKLNLSNKREEALVLTEIAAKEFPDSKEIDMLKAFLLFHIAIDNSFEGGIEKKESMLDEATKIYEIYVDDGDMNINSNANFFLAQMMAIRGDKKALKMSQENYDRNPNSLSANRLYDVHLRLGLIDEAKELFKLYEKHAIDENIPLIYLILDKVSFYKSIGETEKAEQFRKKGLEMRVTRDEEIAAQKLLK